ncbi:MAG: hypothetical protein ACYDEA_08040 [Candidatus Dormibacteria bacterium]
MHLRVRTGSAVVGRTWLRVGLLSAIAVALAGCQASPIARPTPSPSPTAPIVIPSGDGVVVGGIDPCVGIYTKKILNLGFVAGTVIVLRGTTTFVSGPVAGAPGASGRTVLPTDKVTSQTVLKHQEFRFSLPPGPYVLAVQVPKGDNYLQSVPVVVRVGKVTQATIGNACI